MGALVKRREEEIEEEVGKDSRVKHIKWCNTGVITGLVIWYVQSEQSSHSLSLRIVESSSFLLWVFSLVVQSEG